MIWFYLIFAAVVAIPLVIEATRKQMNDTTRSTAPGAFAELSQGVTHYQWFGPKDGPVAVCVHGLTTPSFVWGGLAKGLARMGFRVLTYDLYGRGYSDRPRGAQDSTFFDRQLTDLIEDQQVRDGITLIGYSMGGAIATVFAATRPERLREMILIAPAGMTPIARGLVGFAVRTPIIGTWLMMVRYPTLLRKGLAAERGGHSSVENITSLQEAELNWRGFVPAVRESLRGLLSEEFQRRHETVQQAGLPVLAIWGSEDDVIPLTAAETLKNWNSDVRNVVIDGAGHGLTYSHTLDVLGEINGFTHQAD